VPAATLISTSRPLAVDSFGAAAMLAIGRTRFLEIAAAEGIQSVRIGRRRVYPVSELEAFLERQLTAAAN